MVKLNITIYGMQYVCFGLFFVDLRDGINFIVVHCVNQKPPINSLRSDVLATRSAEIGSNLISFDSSSLAFL